MNTLLNWLQQNAPAAYNHFTNSGLNWMTNGPLAGSNPAARNQGDNDGNHGTTGEHAPGTRDGDAIRGANGDGDVRHAGDGRPGDHTGGSDNDGRDNDANHGMTGEHALGMMDNDALHGVSGEHGFGSRDGDARHAGDGRAGDHTGGSDNDGRDNDANHGASGEHALGTRDNDARHASEGNAEYRFDFSNDNDNAHLNAAGDNDPVYEGLAGGEHGNSGLFAGGGTGPLQSFHDMDLMGEHFASYVEDGGFGL